MAGFAGGSDDEIISAINITPLVDVVLVLLIIFMITAPVIYQSAIKVQLPKAASGEKTDASPMKFTLTKEGVLSGANGKPMDWKDLSPYIHGLTEQARQEPALISADEATAHGTVVKLMDMLRQEGVTRFALNVESSAAPSR